MDKEMKSITIEALDMKITSLRRAEKGSPNPEFKELYEKQISLCNKAKDAVRTLK